MIPKTEIIRAIVEVNSLFNEAPNFQWQFKQLPEPTTQYARIDASDYVKPVNGYQVKQRKRKAMRKGVR